MRRPRPLGAWLWELHSKRLPHEASRIARAANLRQKTHQTTWILLVKPAETKYAHTQRLTAISARLSLHVRKSRRKVSSWRGETFSTARSLRIALIFQYGRKCSCVRLQCTYNNHDGRVGTSAGDAGLGGSVPLAHLTGSEPSTKSIVPPEAKQSSQVSHALSQALPFTFRLCT